MDISSRAMLALGFLVAVAVASTIPLAPQEQSDEKFSWKCKRCIEKFVEAYADRAWVDTINDELPCPCEARIYETRLESIDDADREIWGFDPLCKLNGKDFDTKVDCKYNNGAFGCLRRNSTTDSGIQTCCYQQGEGDLFTLIDPKEAGAGFPRRSIEEDNEFYRLCSECEHSDCTATLFQTVRYGADVDSCKKYVAPVDEYCVACEDWYTKNENKHDWTDKLERPGVNDFRCPCHVQPKNGARDILEPLDSYQNKKVSWIPHPKCQYNGGSNCTDRPGAFGCIRSQDDTGAGAAQECCYDKAFRLLDPGHLGAGLMNNVGVNTNSADRAALLAKHYEKDIKPFNDCCQKCSDPCACKKFRSLREGSNSHCF